MILLEGERERNVAMWEERVDVNAVVVSFAKTPLNAAHAPEEMARIIHIGWRRNADKRDVSCMSSAGCDAGILTDEVLSD